MKYLKLAENRQALSFALTSVHNAYNREHKKQQGNQTA